MVKKVISKEAIVKRVDTNLKIRKAPTKSELEIQVKKLQQTNDALEESNRKKIELLERFDEKIMNLEKKIDYLSCKEIMLCKGTQTEADLSSKCEECNFDGENEKELGWHMANYHGWPSDQRAEKMDISGDSQGVRYCEKCGYKAEDKHDLDAHESIEHISFADDIHKPFACNFCEHCFKNKSELMKHKKLKHSEKVNICWKFPHKTCSYDNETCWFHHSDITENFPCNFCDESFSNQSKFMRHRKKYHEHVVPSCRNNSNSLCIYTNENCWFKHDENENEGNENMNNKNKNKNGENENKNSENENKQSENENKKSENKNVDEEVIQQLFKMMEKFTNQITQMKEKNNLM